jgi:hypothetical protein
MTGLSGFRNQHLQRVSRKPRKMELTDGFVRQLEKSQTKAKLPMRGAFAHQAISLQHHQQPIHCAAMQAHLRRKFRDS